MKFKANHIRKRVIKGPAGAPLAQNKYCPVDCEFTDELEHFSVLKIKVEVRYWGDDSKLAEESGLIVDITSREKQEFIKMESGVEIRLDRIYEISADSGVID